MTRSWHSVAAAASLGVMVVTIAGRRVKAQTSCVIFDATDISGSTDATADFGDVYESSFSCADNAFFQGFGVNYDGIYGNINALQFTCTDGVESEWFGGADEFNIDSKAFDVGIASIESRQVKLSYTYIGMLYVKGYDLTLANGLIEKPWGPYGPGEGDNYTETVMSTDCRSTGLEAFATGVTVWASGNNVYGVRFVCVEVTPTCYPPSYPPTPVVPTPSPTADPSTPAPVPLATSPLYPGPTPTPTAATRGIDDESRWFDAAWEVVVTVLGALATGTIALLLRVCYRGSFESCRRPVVVGPTSQQYISPAERAPAWTKP